MRNKTTHYLIDGVHVDADISGKLNAKTPELQRRIDQAQKVIAIDEAGERVVLKDRQGPTGVSRR